VETTEKLTPIQVSELRQDFLLWSGNKFPRDCSSETIEGFLNTSYAWFVHYEPVPEVTREQVESVLKEWNSVLGENQFYTDYPFTELGDEPNKEAPVREVYLIGFDGDKYVDVLVEGRMSSVKYGYIYREAKRFGETPSCTIADIQFSVCGGGQP
jgi:hypothetical protein